MYNLISRSLLSFNFFFSLDDGEANSRTNTNRQCVCGKECDSSLNGHFQRSFQQTEQAEMTENSSSFQVKCSLGLSRGFVSPFIMRSFIHNLAGWCEISMLIAKIKRITLFGFTLKRFGTKFNEIFKNIFKILLNLYYALE